MLPPQSSSRASLQRGLPGGALVTWPPAAMTDFYPESAAGGGAHPGSGPGNVPEFTVSEISFAVKRTLEGTFERVRVRGEISGFKRAASGHCYMALKDADAEIGRAHV